MVEIPIRYTEYINALLYIDIFLLLSIFSSLYLINKKKEIRRI